MKMSNFEEEHPYKETLSTVNWELAADIALLSDGLKSDFASDLAK
jgi:hypothetical protein